MDWKSLLSDALSDTSKFLEEAMFKNNSSDLVPKAVNRELLLLHYDAEDEDERIIFKVELDNIENYPEEMIDYDIQPLSLELAIRGRNEEYYLRISRFEDEIDPTRTELTIVSGHLCFIFYKVKPKKWNSFQYHHPQVLTNFNASLKSFLKSSPTLQRGMKNKVSHLFHMPGIEMTSSIGIDMRNLLNNQNILLPSNVITTNQILEFLKMKLAGSYSVIHAAMLSIMFYLNEKEKYEQLHPEVIQEYDRHSKVQRNSCNAKAEEWKNKGNNLMKKKNHHDAIQAYSEAIKLDPECPIYYLNRAIGYFHMEVLECCLNDASKAVSLDPFYGKAYYYLGKSFINNCFTDNAIEVLRKAKLLSPEDRDVEEQLCKAYTLKHHIDSYVDGVRLGNTEKRDVSINYIMKVLDREAACGRLLKLLCDEGFTTEAKVEATKLCRFCRYKEAMKFYFLSICFYFENNEAKFQENFRKYKPHRSGILKMVAGHEYVDSIEEIFSHRRKGDEMFKGGRYEEAISWYTKAVENTDIIPSIEARFHLRIARAYQKLDKVKEAYDALTKAIDQKGYCHEAHVTRGELSLKERKFNAAHVDFRTANHISPCVRYLELIDRAKMQQPLDYETITDNEILGDSALERSQNKENKPPTYERKEKTSQRIQKQKLLAVDKKNKGNKQFRSKQYKEAIYSYSEAIELDAEDPVFYLNRAVCHIMLKNYSGGLKDAEKAVNLDDKYVKGLYRLGQCYSALGRPEDAIEVLGKAIAIKSEVNIETELDKANELKNDIRKADSAFDTKNFKNGEMYYFSALTMAECCPTLRLKRIECLLHLGKFDLALSEAEITDALCSNNSEVYYFMGLCHFLKDKKKAMEYFEKSFTLNPSDCRVIDSLAMLREYEKVSRSANREMRENSEKETQAKLINIFSSGKARGSEMKGNEKGKGDGCTKKKVRTQYSTAVSRSSAGSEEYINKSLSFLEKKNYRLALKEAKNAVQADPNCLHGYLIIGRCNTVLGDVEEALEAYKEARKLDVISKDAELGIIQAEKLGNALKSGEKLVKNNDFKNAYGNFRCASRIAPKSPSIFFSLAECLINLKKWTEIKSLLDKTDVDLHGSGEFLCINGLFRFHTTCEEKETLDYVKGAIDVDPSNKTYHQYMDIIQATYEKRKECLTTFQNGDLDHALRLFKSGLDVAANSNRIYADFLYHIGHITLLGNDTRNAIHWFTKSIDEHSTVQALEKRALCFEKLQEISDAILDYNTLHRLTSDPKYKKIINDLRKLENKAVASS